MIFYQNQDGHSRILYNDDEQAAAEAEAEKQGLRYDFPMAKELGQFQKMDGTSFAIMFAPFLGPMSWKTLATRREGRDARVDADAAAVEELLHQLHRLLGALGLPGARARRVRSVHEGRSAGLAHLPVHPEDVCREMRL